MYTWKDRRKKGGRKGRGKEEEIVGGCGTKEDEMEEWWKGDRKRVNKQNTFLTV